MVIQVTGAFCGGSAAIHNGKENCCWGENEWTAEWECSGQKKLPAGGEGVGEKTLELCCI